MSAPFRTRRRVEFRDTDAAGIVHFSAYFTYMEAAEHELLRSLGTSVVVPLEEGDAVGGTISWPRVAAECQYTGPARFEDELEIDVQVERVGRSSVTYGFRFLVTAREIARGTLTVVCCRFVPGQPATSISIPEPLRRQLMELQAP
jgi:acyl-CoA thioester hydrolase